MPCVVELASLHIASCVYITLLELLYLQLFDGVMCSLGTSRAFSLLNLRRSESNRPVCT